MLLQDNKKGVSEMVGYVLLVVFAVIMGGIVFAWLKTYVPAEGLNCPDGTSLFLKELTFSDSASQLNLTVKNNGRFNIAGYFIYASNDSSQELSVIDLSAYLNESLGGKKFGSSVVFILNGENFLKPGDQATNIFDIPAEMGKPYSIRVIPVRYQTEKNRERFVSCSEAVVNQVVGEPIAECIQEDVSVTCGTWICGNRINNCGNSVSCPPDNCSISGQVCNSTGSCVAPVPNCGNSILNAGEGCDDGNTNTGDGCSGTCTVESGYSCSSQPSVCILLCGNGVINSGEACDDGNPNNGDGCSATCTIESGYICSGQPSVCSINVNSCPSYCASLGYNGTTSSCTNSVGNCQNGGGVYQSGGDQWCTGGSQADTCCCKL